MGRILDIHISWLPQVIVAVVLIFAGIAVIKNVCKIKRLQSFIAKFPWVLLIASAIAGFVQVELADRNNFIINMPVVQILVNILSLLLLLLILYIITNRCWISVIVFQCMVVIIGTINHYTLFYRGTPVSAPDVPSAGTAIRVSADLQFDLKIMATFLVITAALQMAAAICLRKCEYKKPLKYILIRDCSILAGTAAVFGFLYFSPFSPKPANTVAWIWRDQYWKYGYTACTVESVQNFMNVIKKPEGYTPEKAAEYAKGVEPKAADVGAKPDIILILNETFYDFSLISDFQTDVEITPYINSLENVIKGYTVVPTLGGGTNRSEYELLTGNSLSIMQQVLPFWSLNLTDADSIVSLLEQQGYYTMALHQGNRQNYNRVTGYGKLGFDVYYSIEDFETYELVHGYCSDKSGYEFIIDKYEQRDKSRPFFAYNLTIQNHITDTEMEDMKVHTISGMDGLRDKTDLYFSCLRESDEAFRYLTEYFAAQDQPVIICMMGDHGPNFVNDVKKKSDLSERLEKFGIYSTPFLIWTNYEIQQEDWGFLGLPYVAPKLLNLAGLGLSPYFSYMLDMADKVPVISSFHIFEDADGNIFSETKGTPYEDIFRGYWYMEYNGVYNLKQKNLNIFSYDAFVRKGEEK